MRAGRVFVYLLCTQLLVACWPWPRNECGDDGLSGPGPHSRFTADDIRQMYAYKVRMALPGQRTTKEVPSDIDHETLLRTEVLDFAKVQIGRLPPWLTKFTNVRRLILTKTNIDACSLGPLREMPNLLILDLSENDLFRRGSSLGSMWEKLKNLHELYLADSGGKAADYGSLGKLTNLVKLSLSKNKITDLRSLELSRLPLRELELAHNPLDRVELKNLPTKTLIALDLSYTGLRNLTFADMPSLVWLKLNGNGAIAFDKGSYGVFTLKSLARLDVDNEFDAPYELREILFRNLNPGYDGPVVPIARDPTGLIYTLAGHTDLVWSVAFLQTGRRVLSAGKDQTLKLWDLNDARPVLNMRNSSGTVYALAVARGGQLAASGDASGEVKLWNLVTAKSLRSFQRHPGWVRALDISQDRNSLLSGSQDGTLKLWDVSSGELQHTFTGHAGEVRAVAFSPDGRLGVSGSWDGTLKLWDLPGRRQLSTIVRTKTTDKPAPKIYAVAFSPDGKSVASGSEDGWVEVWDLSHRDRRSAFRASREVLSVAFSPDGGSILYGGADKTIVLRDIETGSVIWIYRGHSNMVESVAFSPDGRLVVSGSTDRTLKLWAVPLRRQSKGDISNLKAVE